MSYTALRDGSRAADFKPIDQREVSPRGLTPLLDAVGRITATMLSESPDRAMLVIVTDGCENASREWTKPRIRSRLDEMKAKDWQILFVGADFDAFSEAAGLGISQSATLTMSSGHYGAAMASLATRSADYAASGQSVAFSDEDRAAASGDEAPSGTSLCVDDDGFVEIETYPDLTDDGRPPRSARRRNLLMELEPGEQPNRHLPAASGPLRAETVSHVLSGRVAVSAPKRIRVEDAIRALDYHPAESARSLTSRRRAADPIARLDASVPRLTTVGYVSVDYLACLDRLPAREERLMSREIVKAIGGPAANVAAIAAGIGGEWPVAASIITALGVDQDSDWAVAELAARRVDLILPRERREGRLNRAIVLVEADGRRTIVNEPSSLAEVDVRRFMETTDPTGLAWCLHVEGYQVPGQIAAMAAARARGFRPTMQATGLPPGWLGAHVDALFSTFEVVVLHRESLPQLPGCPDEPAAALPWIRERAQGQGAAWPEVVIVTLGRRGAYLVERGGAVAHAPALPVRVRDTTGAGDALVGAFLALWLNGAPPGEALAFACAAGSLAATRMAAQELRPTASDLAALLGRSALPAGAALSAIMPIP